MRMNLKTRLRRGFTLIELLVVIAIIIVLIGLLLPAVQKIREAASRTKCANNLKQLGLAAQNYHDLYNHFPPGIGYYPFTASDTFGTYFFHLLPYLEQDPLYRKSFDTASFLSPVGPTTLYYPGNNTVYSRAVKTLLCPSDPSIDSEGTVMIDGIPFGAASYAPNGLISGTPPPTPSPQGKTRILDITDGASNTILHAEKYARCSNGYLSPPFRDGGTAWAYCTAKAFAWQPPPMAFPGKAFQPGFAIAGLVTLGAPDAIGENSFFQVRPDEGRCDPTRASTPHTAGILVGLVDGSVRKLSSTMSHATWWAAVTPKGDEVVNLD